MCTKLCTKGVTYLDLIRIGDKMISRQRIANRVERVLDLRAQGKSQQDVADELGLDRVWISRLESLGEVRKGGRLALIGFPIANCTELHEVATSEGVEFCLLLNDKERWAWAADFSGASIFNKLMEMISEIKQYDTLIFLGSDMRIRLMEAILGPEMVVGVELGTSPISEDKYMPPEVLQQLIRNLKGR